MSRSVQNQKDYNAKYSGMSDRYEKASKRLAEVGKDIAARNAKRSELESFLKLLDCREHFLAEFDENLWLGVVHQVKVQSAIHFRFVLKDGREMPFVRTH